VHSLTSGPRAESRNRPTPYSPLTRRDRRTCPFCFHPLPPPPACDSSPPASIPPLGMPPKRGGGSGRGRGRPRKNPSAASAPEVSTTRLVVRLGRESAHAPLQSLYTHALLWRMDPATLLLLCFRRCPFVPFHMVEVESEIPTFHSSLVPTVPPLGLGHGSGVLNLFCFNCSCYPLL
jgi:hypothetical protein